MDDAVEICAALSVAENVRAFIIIAGNFEEGLKTDAVHYGGFDICARKSYEARKETIELLLNIVANSFGFIIVENCILSVARAKETAIGQFGEITFDWEAANEAVVWKFGTLLADVLLFFSNFIDEDENDFADVVATNGAFIRDGSSGEAPCADERKQKQPDS